MTTLSAGLQRDTNTVSESFRIRFGPGLSSFDWMWGGGETRLDVAATRSGVEVSIELPGMDMDDIEVNATDDMLTIKDEK